MKHRGAVFCFCSLIGKDKGFISNWTRVREKLLPGYLGSGHSCLKIPVYMKMAKFTWKKIDDDGYLKIFSNRFF